jgi:uncharacterized Fe-S center protein
MASEVFLCRITDWSDEALVRQGLAAVLEASALLDPIAPRQIVGVKLTFGEAGNTGHPPAALVRQIVEAVRARGARPFLTETNTLYNGRRKNSVDHLEVAREHGFTHETIGAPIVLSDGVRGRESLTVALRGERVSEAHLAPVVRDVDFLVVVSHLTGHLVHGFGGALKNLGMGLASRAGKLAQHSSVNPTVKAEKCIRCLACLAACPADAITDTGAAALISAQACIGCAECLAVCPTGAVTNDWSRESAHVQEATAEYALAVHRTVKGRAAYVNLLNHISRHCDCMGHTPDCLTPDIGIAAGRDLVAVDQASYDLACQAAGRNVFREAWREVDPEVQLRHAERMGLGRRTYTLREVAGG